MTEAEKIKVLRPATKTVWTIYEARRLTLRLEKALRIAECHVALAGSVLHAGESKKDLDIVIYPRSSRYFDLDRVRAVLEDAGLRCAVPLDEVHRDWRRRGIKDKKRVEVWAWKLRRVDIMFLK